MKLKKHLFKKSKQIVLIGLSIFALISCTTTPVPLTPETALQSYLQNEDESFAWNLKESYPLDDLEVYDLRLTSQKWREHTWKHTITVIVPEEMNHDGALLFITGGKNKDGEPIKRGGDDDFIKTMAQLAMKNSAMVAIIWQIPNQPLYDGMTEDELISFTLHNYQNDGDLFFLCPLVGPGRETF